MAVVVPGMLCQATMLVVVATTTVVILLLKTCAAHAMVVQGSVSMAIQVAKWMTKPSAVEVAVVAPGTNRTSINVAYILGEPWTLTPTAVHVVEELKRSTLTDTRCLHVLTLTTVL